MVALSSTSALVLLWTPEAFYQSDCAKKFLQNMDLTAGLPLKKELAVWEHIDQEVVNRKFGVRKLCLNFLKGNPRSQVVFLAAGLDPVSIDLADGFPGSRVFDVDVENMDVKERINREIGGPENIRFCKADLAGDFTEVLSGRGWSPDKKTLVVAEGISYYVERPVFVGALLKLKSDGGMLVLDYSIPESDMRTPRRKTIYREYAAKLSAMTGCSVFRYRDCEMRDLAGQLEGELVGVKNQTDLEKERTGRNRHYLSDNGAIHLACVGW